MKRTPHKSNTIDNYKKYLDDIADESSAISGMTNELEPQPNEAAEHLATTNTNKQHTEPNPDNTQEQEKNTP